MTICEGCDSYRLKSCALDVYTINLCPCGLCLIKGICRVSCKEYIIFREEDNIRLFGGRRNTG